MAAEPAHSRVRVVKQLLEEEEDVQVVVTTHSPYIFDELAPSDVHVFVLDDEQSVVVKSLAEHPEAEKMKGVLTSGQIWSLDPEHEWVNREARRALRGVERLPRRAGAPATGQGGTGDTEPKASAANPHEP